MKRFTLVLCMLASFVSIYAQAPQWVTRRPVADGKYIGIGMAPVSDPDCRNVAVANAMLDIASQISVNIESTSFMQTLDVDGRSRELFEEKVRTKMAANLSGQELKDSYQSASHYYVYYELDKKKYEKFVEEQKKKGVAILYVGEDLDVLMELCDRIMVINSGRVTGIVDGRTARKDEIGLLMTKSKEEMQDGEN